MKKVLFIAFCFIASSVWAQDALQPKPSPTDIAKEMVGETYIKVTYARPHKKGRAIFGELVPYGKVWRTGANEATEITFTKDVVFGGKELAAGTYALFTIPNTSEWTIILNSDLGQWGAYGYKEKNDVLRVNVPVEKADAEYEPFTIKVKKNGKEASLQLMWDTTQVSVPIQTK
ncbi:DUF2911 domain-containing protein [Cytophagales bacterium LB-30]|uniref:DUF2911 domain-containing protein n=1 Tax=Shiella aurantiaca TaxID=3058365 RepID=A0ABT8F4T1_9BACT|nr:DUF2911 domain-containing protein [Shiella aurantiaca]MDN4165451.1 DUF2911 domain-containing protein [Shiella aurantiaca]